MIQGYPDESSVFPGGTLTLRVSTDAPWFRYDVYRQGQQLDHVHASGWFAGVFADEHRWDDDWSQSGVTAGGQPAAAWAHFDLPIPTQWSSGVYIVMFTEGDAAQQPQAPFPDTATADARLGKALFVIRSLVPGVQTQLLYKLPLFTYHAYNAVGGNSIYQGVDVHFHRPGGGTGGVPWDGDARWLNPPNLDPFDAGSPRQVFEHWDAKLIRWLESQNYRVDYCTDLDLHREGFALLSPYALVLSVGHDEYFSPQMRNALEQFRDLGGNIAFLSGNTCWWRVEFDPVDPLRMRGQQTIGNWYLVGTPEDALTGVSFRNAGEGNYARPKVGFTVQHSNQWPFEGCGLSDGDSIGDAHGIVGYECDGAPFQALGTPVSPDYSDPTVGTPPGFTILGTGTTSPFDYPLGNRFATMGMYTINGTVFTGATTDWARVVPIDGTVERITRNVIDRLGGAPKGLATLTTAQQVIACDGFYTPDDQFRHAIIATQPGDITEIFYHPQQGQGQTVIAQQPGVLDVAAFWSDDDGFRHAITVLNTGEVWEIFFHPSTGTGRTLLTTIPGAFRVAAFYSDDDHFRHAIVATHTGEIWEVFYHPTHGVGSTQLASIPGCVDVGAFWSPDDQYRHAVVALASGVVTEIYFHPSTGVAQAIIGSVPGARRVSAYYAADDAFFNRRVLVATSASLSEIRFHPSFGTQRALLFPGAAVDVGGFFSADDGYRHAILSRPSAHLQELFFKP